MDKTLPTNLQRNFKKGSELHQKQTNIFSLLMVENTRRKFAPPSIGVHNLFNLRYVAELPSASSNLESLIKSKRLMRI